MDQYLYGLKRWSNNTRKTADLIVPRQIGYHPSPVDGQDMTVVFGRVTAYNVSTGFYTCKAQSVENPTTKPLYVDSTQTISARDSDMLSGKVDMATQRYKVGDYVIISQSLIGNVIISREQRSFLVVKSGAAKVLAYGGNLVIGFAGRNVAVSAFASTTVASNDYVWLENSSGTWQIQSGSALPTTKPYIALARVHLNVDSKVDKITYYWNGGDIHLDPMVRFGKPTSSFSSGSSITLDPCDPNGIDTGEINVTANLSASLNIGSYDAGGGSTSTSSTLSTSAIVAFVWNPSDGSHNILGEPSVAIVKQQYNTSNHKLEAKVQWCIGGALSSVSDWLPVRECTATTVLTGVSLSGSGLTFTRAVLYSPEVATETDTTIDVESTQTTPCDETPP